MDPRSVLRSMPSCFPRIKPDRFSRFAEQPIVHPVHGSDPGPSEWQVIAAARPTVLRWWEAATRRSQVPPTVTEATDRLWRDRLAIVTAPGIELKFESTATGTYGRTMEEGRWSWRMEAHTLCWLFEGLVWTILTYSALWLRLVAKCRLVFVMILPIGLWGLALRGQGPCHEPLFIAADSR